MRIFIFVLTLLLLKSSFACERPLVLSFNGDWAPYFYKVGDETYAGSDFLVLSRTLNTMSCPLEVLPMTPKRALLEKSKGTFDIFVGASYTEARYLDFFYTHSYRKEVVGYAYNTKKAGVNANNLEDIVINGGHIALNIHGYFGDEVERLKQDYPKQFVHSFSTTERMKMLNEGLVSVVVDDKSALCKDANRFIKNPELKHYKISAQELHRDDIHFIFNRSTVTQEFINTFNQALSKELKSSTLTKLNSCL